MRGGLRLTGKKDSTLITWAIHRPRPAHKIQISLDQGRGLFAAALVKIGDRVRLGQTIAEPSHTNAVTLHASLSGEVTAVDSLAIEISSDGRDEASDGTGKQRPGWETLSLEKKLALFQDSGLVDLAGDGEAVHAKVRRALESGIKIHTLVLNGCESEPYLSADHALMMSHPVEILKGAEILRQILGAQKVVIAVEDNKLEPAELFKSKIFFLKWKNFDTAIFPTCYPQEDEGFLIPAIYPRHNPPPERGRKEEGVIVFSVATAFAVFEAVVLCKPLYERVVTVGGECVIEPKNIWARMGTSFADCVKNARGLLREPGKIVMGGPMRGAGQKTLEVPVIPQTRAILALPKELTETQATEPCIRCGRCVEVCPADISPALITLAVEKNLFEFIDEEDVKLCTECGLCAYVCPAHRPMTELMQEAKINV